MSWALWGTRRFCRVLYRGQSEQKVCSSLYQRTMHRTKRCLLVCASFAFSMHLGNWSTQLLSQFQLLVGNCTIVAVDIWSSVSLHLLPEVASSLLLTDFTLKHFPYRGCALDVIFSGCDVACIQKFSWTSNSSSTQHELNISLLSAWVRASSEIKTNAYQSIMHLIQKLLLLKL